MKSTSTYLLAIVAVATLNLSGAVAFAEEVSIFKDSFSDMKGYMVRQTDGKITNSGVATRRIATFMGTSKDAVGELIIVGLEDDKTVGPDKKPGVLAISYRSLPDKGAYSGVVYFGGISEDKALTLKEIAEAPKVERLKQLKVTFKYRAVNAVNADDEGATYDCRLEPNVVDPYSKRIGLGSIRATSKWKTFEKTLDRGANIEAFLQAVVDKRPKLFKLVWAQSGSISNYQAGDTLLIDDVEIFRIP